VDQIYSNDLYQIKNFEKPPKMKKNKKSKSPGKSKSPPPQKANETNDNKNETQFGGLDMGNFQKNMGCGS
jgi:hypothetical protein